jgi:hypothetical protein
MALRPRFFPRRGFWANKVTLCNAFTFAIALTNSGVIIPFEYAVSQSKPSMRVLMGLLPKFGLITTDADKQKREQEEICLPHLGRGRKA